MSEDRNEEKTAMSATEPPTPVPDPIPPHASAYAEEDDFAEEAWEDEQEQDRQPLPRRPRRRLLTPLTALLFALLVGAGGFIAGVQVEKGEVPASSGTRGAGRLAGLLGAASTGAASSGTTGAAGAGGAGGVRFFGGGGGAAGAGATVGQVANISGSDLYVTNLEGNTVKVLANAAQVTKQVSSSVKGVHPGDSVVVQGATRGDGSIQARTVRDSGSSESGGVGALFGGSSGASTGGSSGRSSGSGSSGGEPALFGR